MTTDIKQLLAVCEAATQGEYEIGHDEAECAATLRVTLANEGPIDVILPFGKAYSDARYFSTFSPAKVRALLERAERDAVELDAARTEALRLRVANASLVPDAILAVTNVECMRVELAAARDEAQRLAAERDACRRDYLTVADALLPESDGPEHLAGEARRLRAALARAEAERNAYSALFEVKSLQRSIDEARAETQRAEAERIAADLDALARDEHDRARRDAVLKFGGFSWQTLTALAERFRSGAHRTEGGDR